MPVTVQNEGDGVYRVEASGILLKSELDGLQVAAAQVIATQCAMAYYLTDPGDHDSDGEVNGSCR